MIEAVEVELPRLDVVGVLSRELAPGIFGKVHGQCTGQLSGECVLDGKEIADRFIEAPTPGRGAVGYLQQPGIEVHATVARLDVTFHDRRHVQFLTRPERARLQTGKAPH